MTSFRNFGVVAGVGNTHVGATPPTVLDGSTLWFNTNPGENRIYYYDTSRSKWLSVAEMTLLFGNDSGNNTYIRPAGVSSPGNFTGFYLDTKYTLCEVLVAARGLSNSDLSKTLEFRTIDFTTVDVETLEDTFTLNRANGTDPLFFSKKDLNIAVEDKRVGFFVTAGAPGFNDICVTATFRRRYEVP